MMRTPSQDRRRQLGAVAIIVAITLPVLLGFAGLALDLGRLYVEKTELQNATDACALAAARELTCDPATGACTTTFLQNAANAGHAVALRNSASFQKQVVDIPLSNIKFGMTLAPNSAYFPFDGGANPNSKYVMCTAEQTGIVPWFMKALNLIPGVAIGDSTVRAQAVASLVPSQSNCGIPLGMCANGAATDPVPFGLEKGKWYSGKFSSGGGLTGSFNWIDFTPPAGGESELSALITGSGVCNMNVTSPVGQTGVLGNAAAKAWNSRFGLYQSGPINIDTAAPDYTGYSYTTQNWPSGSGALADFLSKRSTHDPYGATVAAGNTLTGLSINNSYNPTTTAAQHSTKGADRRLVVSPIVNCGDWASSNTVPIRGWACVLMLHPISSPGDTVHMEYLGLSSDPDSPCATSGMTGGPGSKGPLVPTLVQ